MQRMLAEDLSIDSIDWLKRDWFEYRGPLFLTGQWLSCWGCQKRFARGDRISVVGTSDGEKQFHNQCYDYQRPTLLEAIFDDGSDPFINA